MIYRSPLGLAADERLADLLDGYLPESTACPGEILGRYRASDGSVSFIEWIADELRSTPVEILERAARRSCLPIVDPIAVGPNIDYSWEIEGLPVYFLSRTGFGEAVVAHCLPALPEVCDDMFARLAGAAKLHHVLCLPEDIVRLRQRLAETDRLVTVDPAKLDHLPEIDSRPFEKAWKDSGILGAGDDDPPSTRLRSWLTTAQEDDPRRTAVNALLGDIPYLVPGHVDRETLVLLPASVQRHFGVSPIFRCGRLVTLLTPEPPKGQRRAELLTSLGGLRAAWVLGPLERVRELISHADLSGISSEDMASRVTINSESAASTLARVNTDALREVSDASSAELVDTLLLEAAALRASDIHISSQRERMRVRFRVDGRCIDHGQFASELFPSVMTRIKVMANLDTVRAQLPVNGKLERLINDRAYDVRVNVCPTELGGDIALRLLPRAQDIPSFGDLGIPEREQAIFREVIGADNGLCLITGPTGAGKSTTLYAVMGVIDRFTWRVLSGEDPVEILVPQVEQTEIKPPMTPKIYAENMLRRDPDYLIFSEVRDRDTAGILVGASMTGHVVFSTLHCNSCMEAGLRMIDLAVDPFLLAESLKACFAQRLVRRVCDHCAGQDRVPDGEYLERAGLDASWFGTNPRFRRGQGCKACGLTGYRGRTCVIEGYLVDDDIRRQILGGHPDPRRIEERMRADGGRTIVENACALAGKGLTTLEEVLSIKAIRF